MTQPANYSSVNVSKMNILRRTAAAHPLALRKILEGDRCLTPPFLVNLNEKLGRTIVEPDLRLSVSMPPRHSKSQSCSLWLPTWYLWLRPEHRVILATYAADFSRSWGRKVRDQILQYKDFLQINLSESAQAADQWETDRGGGMKTAGRDGPINGFGANLLIADDLIKNAEEANSQAIRDSSWEWWTSTARTRLEPRGNIVILATRWHEDDPIGRIAAMEQRNFGEGLPREGWEFFVYPAVAYGLGTDASGKPRKDNLGRVDGDVLWPERYDKVAMKRIERSVGPIVWNALYQQTPVPPDGDFFRKEWVKTYTMSRQSDRDCLTIETGPGKHVTFFEDEMQTFLVADTAMTTRKENDATAIGVFWITPRRHLILKAMYHGRMSGPDVEKKITDLYRQHGCMFMAVENRANGTVALQRFQDAGFVAKPIQAVTDKVTRATPLQIMMEQGRVFLPADFPYWDVFYREFLKFPKGRHDDVVDMFAHAATVLTQQTYDRDGGAVVVDLETEENDMESIL